MPASDLRPDQGPGILGPVGIVPMNGTGALQGCFMEDPLALSVIAVGIPEAFEPFLGNLLEELGQARGGRDDQVTPMFEEHGTSSRACSQ
jgi:hypothetical protein